MSALFRSLGPLLSLSIGMTLNQNTIRQTLHKRLSGADVEEVIQIQLLSSRACFEECARCPQIILRVRESLGYIRELEPEVREAVIRSYADGCQVAIWFGVAMAFAALVCSIFIKEKSLGR